MKTSVKTFLEMTPIGCEVDVATSNYSVDPIPENNWNPTFRMTHQAVKSMEKQGLVKAKYFWRGCTVKRLK